MLWSLLAINWRVPGRGGGLDTKSLRPPYKGSLQWLSIVSIRVASEAPFVLEIA
jgi:hypothetical protein